MARLKRTEDQLVDAILALNKAGSQSEAARSLNMNRNTYISILAEAKRRFPKLIEKQKTTDNEEQVHPVEEHRLKKSLSVQRRRAEEAESFAAKEATIREAAFGLTEHPLAVPHWNPKPHKSPHKKETIVLFLSDVHMGENVNLEAMGGRNSYNVKIARNRLEKFFTSVVSLGTEHWTGPGAEALYLILGGDLVSGEIHDELAKTNDLLALPAVREVSECIAAGIEMLRRNFIDIPIHIISVPGNHGRTTRKPESKDFAVNSYDTLVAWQIESWVKAREMKNVFVSAPASGDALVNIYGYNVLFTHGDRIGSRGGMGHIGPASPVAKGMKQVVQDYLSGEAVIVDYVIMGHYHTPLELEYGFVNSSLVGPSEYSKSGRMKNHAPTQLMLSFHPSRGVSRRWRVHVYDKSEGSLYRPRGER